MKERATLMEVERLGSAPLRRPLTAPPTRQSAERGVEVTREPAGVSVRRDFCPGRDELKEGGVFRRRHLTENALAMLEVKKKKKQMLLFLGISLYESYLHVNEKCTRINANTQE